MSFWGDVSGFFGVGSGDPNNPSRDALSSNAQAASQYGGQWANNFNNSQAGINSTAAQLEGLANGNNSVSMEQARQNMQTGQAQQIAQAAAASSQNQAMAARTAMINTGKIASAVGGQQAIAGDQERQAALNSLGNLQTQQAQMNMTGALGAYNSANGAYGTVMQNPQKSWWNGIVAPFLGGATQAAGQAMGGSGGGGGAASSAAMAAMG